MFRVRAGELPMVVVLGLDFLGLVLDLGCCWGEAYGVVLGEFSGVLRSWTLEARASLVALL